MCQESPHHNDASFGEKETTTYDFSRIPTITEKRGPQGDTHHATTSTPIRIPHVLVTLPALISKANGENCPQIVQQTIAWTALLHCNEQETTSSLCCKDTNVVVLLWDGSRRYGKEVLSSTCSLGEAHPTRQRLLSTVLLYLQFAVS